MSPQQPPQKKRVLIVGAGAAGMSCAATLANHPDKFSVTLLEREDYVGGQATSIPLESARFGASFLNDGVQGGSPIFRHTFAFFERQGYSAQEVKLQIAFGKGPEEFWSNVFPSQLVERFDKDIKRFGTALKTIGKLEFMFAFVPVHAALKIFRLSPEFGEKMVYPLMALFLGTGNQTAHVSSVILERLFLDPNMKLWDYSPDTLLPNLPTMHTFPHLSEFYKKWAGDLRSKGVEVRTSTELVEVLERSKYGVRVALRPAGSDAPPTEEAYDELVFAVLADDAKRLLGKQATFMERKVLGSARFFDDITITHCDDTYFNKHYETRYSDELVATGERAQAKEQQEQIKFAKDKFAPMYYTKSYADRGAGDKIEMSFDCTNYQPQFDANAGQHVYQTIFLNKENEALWTRGEIAPEKVIKEKWWHQLGHNWQHYLQVVPWLSWLNSPGKGTHTQFVGSWTLVNMHEVACVSGIAAACALGADYAKPDDFAEDFFRKYYLLSHAARFKGTVKTQ